MNVQPSTSTNSVVVTGASRNLGAACALHLDKAGFHVFAGVNNQEDGLALQKRASGHLTPLLLDSTDADSIKAATEMVTKAMGETGLAGLVNSATIIVLGPLESLKADELQTQFKINVVDFLAVTQAFLPLLRQ